MNKVLERGENDNAKTPGAESVVLEVEDDPVRGST